MSGRNAKHRAHLEHRQRQISSCRSSGKPVQVRCEEQGIDRRRYYYREKHCRKESSDSSAVQVDDHSPPVRIAPEQLPESRRAAAPAGHSGMVGMQERIGQRTQALLQGISFSDRGSIEFVAINDRRYARLHSRTGVDDRRSVFARTGG